VKEIPALGNENTTSSASVRRARIRFEQTSRVSLPKVMAAIVQNNPFSYKIYILTSIRNKNLPPLKKQNIDLCSPDFQSFSPLKTTAPLSKHYNHEYAQNRHRWRGPHRVAFV
jgi:hypothetical protein